MPKNKILKGVHIDEIPEGTTKSMSMWALKKGKCSFLHPINGCIYEFKAGNDYDEYEILVPVGHNATIQPILILMVMDGWWADCYI